MNAPSDASRRAGDPTAWASALVLVMVLLPVSVACLRAMVYPLSLWQESLLWLIPVYYCAVVLMFLPGVEDFMWRLAVRGLREPTQQEQSRLRPAWSRVLDAAGLRHQNRYRLRVLETDELNAMAAGGHQVFVTSGALGTVPDTWLPGLLAHELGHHAGLHPIMLSIEVWLLRPIHWVRTIALWLSRVCAWFTLLARGSAIGMFVVLVLFFGLRLLSWILLAVTWVPLALLRVAGRRAEYRADAYAAEIGFRAPLGRFLSALAEIEDDLGDSKHESLADIVASTHPPTRSRIERLQAWRPADGAPRPARSRRGAEPGGRTRRRKAAGEGTHRRKSDSADRSAQQQGQQPRPRRAGPRRSVRLKGPQRTPRKQPPRRRT